MNIWQRKLLAFLHDPPSKPLNLKQHGEIAESLIRAAGFDDPTALRWFFDKVCDHTAAAADRLAFPKPDALACDFTGGPDSPFHHPLGGGKVVFENPISAEQAETAIANAQPAHREVTERLWPDENQRWRVRFFLHWRLWRQSASIRRQGQSADPRLALLPADTRIPDHSTWMHCALVSALQSCVEVEERDQGGELRTFEPAFLLVQIGPVQEFIAQARSTRDLWSGSFLLSWLVASGLKAITDQYGPDCVLFPSLWGQPLFDFLHRDEVLSKIQTASGKTLWDEIRPSDEQILTPNLPNRFLAIVPHSKAEQLAKDAEIAMRHMLTEEIGRACLKWFEQRGYGLPADALIRWNQQLRDFLQIHWQVWPWERNAERAIASFEKLPIGQGLNDSGQQTAASLRAAYDAARKGIPENQLDPRNYSHENTRSSAGFTSKVLPGPDGLPKVENLGFAWAAHYALTDFCIAARRQTRDFNAWGDAKDTARERGASRDQLSGKEEIVGTLDWQERVHELPGHLFRPGELLGAMNLLKRVWHRAYLEKRGLKRKRVQFDSVPAVAAAPWLKRLRERLGRDEDCWHEFIALTTKLAAAEPFIDAEIPPALDANSRLNESDWLDCADGVIYHSTFWQNLAPVVGARQEVKDAAAAMSAFKSTFQLGEPSKYYAVLALDGDEMGKWVSGAKSPRFRDQLAAKAREHFERTQPGAPDSEALAKLLDHPRHLSPSYHLQFSEALCNFSVYLAPAIVEVYDGQPIYAGGDDLLAMLPADNATGCAQALRLAFQGDSRLVDHLKKYDPEAEHVPVLTAQDGFVSLDGAWEGFGSTRRFIPRGVHLLVPGPRATVSVGISISHIKEPLQDMVREAQAAEKRAKNDLGRKALAVTLFKRSGETIEWGAPMASRAFDLLAFFQSYYRVPLDNPNADMPISGKFPHRVAEMLAKFGPNMPVNQVVGDKTIAELAEAEVNWVIGQQTRKVGAFAADHQIDALREKLGELCTHYLSELREDARPLADFYHLFALEAFISRTGE